MKRWAVIGYTKPLLGIVTGRLYSDAIVKAGLRFGAGSIARIVVLQTPLEDDEEN